MNLNFENIFQSIYHFNLFILIKRYVFDNNLKSKQICWKNVTHSIFEFADEKMKETPMNGWNNKGREKGYSYTIKKFCTNLIGSNSSKIAIIWKGKINSESFFLELKNYLENYSLGRRGDFLVTGLHLSRSVNYHKHLCFSIKTQNYIELAHTVSYCLFEPRWKKGKICRRSSGSAVKFSGTLGATLKICLRVYIRSLIIHP